MEVITEYLLSVTGAGILCAIIRNLFGSKQSYGKLIQAVCGVFMAITVFAPIVNFKLNDFDGYFNDIHSTAQDIVEKGSNTALNAMSEIIKQQSESYILDKATAIGADIQVQIQMTESNPPVPKEVILSGNISPYDKKVISQYITMNFGISEENQQWI